MISIYVSHTFIDEFQGRKDLSSDIVNDFRKLFLKRIKGVEVTVDIEFSKLEKLITEDEFYNDLSEISGIKCDDSWVNKLEDEAFLYKGNLSKLFLLGNAIDCDNLVSKYNLLFINNNNLETLWHQVRIDREISEMTPCNANENDYSFDNWLKLSNFKHPFHDLLIFDLYLLCDKSNQKIESNLKPMLQSFSAFTQNGEYQLTIISKEILKPNAVNNPVEKIEDVYQMINRTNCKLVYYDETKATLKEHDRQIITNYMVFDCGAGWNIFKEKGGVNTSTKIIGRSIFRNDAKNSANNALQNFKSYYATIKEKKIQVLIPGLFDENNKLKSMEIDYHFPINFNPSVLE